VAEKGVKMIILSIIIIIWSIYIIISGDYLFGTIFLILGLLSFYNKYKGNN